MRHSTIAVVVACVTATAAVGSEPELDPSEYKPSYKAVEAPPGSSGIVAKEHWGEAVKGTAGGAGGTKADPAK